MGNSRLKKDIKKRSRPHTIDRLRMIVLNYQRNPLHRFLYGFTTYRILYSPQQVLHK
ncbi:hypothetical protein Runsl_1380 [Runella slithyformis DSM 19594]|uniref:Uncharacterized protein n=1 Tax=Runella slithyformis (strain ATCC 29530 / DSM 19594 / LMG 11500 / NCIMB 11436 / LSU 4) TaxID=761193 RepID=A0A7U3ZIF5_RUNSL|nr:hypothetical protein Runsl_1380 [Runella slithyformis DSM 19594]